MRLSENLLAIPPTTGGAWVYALRGNGILLIDAGRLDAFDSIRETLASEGWNPNEVRAVLLTRGDAPQSEAGSRWQTRGVMVGGFPIAAEEAESLWRVASGEFAQVDFTVDDGDLHSVCGLEAEVFYAPGQSLGCCAYLVLLDGATTLFVGDIALPNEAVAPRGADFSAKRLAESLERLSEIEFDRLATSGGVSNETIQGRLWLNQARTRLLEE